MKRTLRAQADFQSTLLRNQLTSLVLYESVTTTKSKAKKLIAFANHFFNRVVPADLNSKRLAAATLFDKNAQEKVFEEILPRYGKTDTTFVRHFRVLPRKGDSAEMVMVSLIKTLQAQKTKLVDPAKPVADTKPVTKKAPKNAPKKESK